MSEISFVGIDDYICVNGEISNFEIIDRALSPQEIEEKFKNFCETENK